MENTYFEEDDPELKWEIESVKGEAKRVLVQAIVKHPPTKRVGYAVCKTREQAVEKALLRLNSATHQALLIETREKA